MSPQFRVTLTKEEVEELQKISSTGSRSAKIVLFARALLLLDKGPHTTEHWTVNQTSKAVGLSERTLNHLRKLCKIRNFSQSPFGGFIFEESDGNFPSGRN